MKIRALLVLLLIPSFLQAQPPGMPPGMARMQLILQTLDVDGDDTLSTEEVMMASERLLTPDMDGDGELNQQEIGAPPPLSAMVRQQYIVRIIEDDGDLLISAEELANASQNIKRLDHDGDWNISSEELGLNNQGPPGAPLPDRVVLVSRTAWPCRCG